MSDVIFVRHPSGLARLVRTVPEQEDPFQALLENHPELLGGGQLRPDGEPLRFLLVQREAGIRDSAVSGNRWSIDHLFIDQHGTPTLVEVKRSTDTRVRREVVGQLLEYAANATAWWEPGLMEQMSRGLYAENYEVVMREFLGDSDASQFWIEADERLASGRIRLLFVADRVPSELRTLIEFLDEKLDGIEVAGVEIVHYGVGDQQAYVPRVVGQSERARSKRQRSSPKSKTTESELLDRVGVAASKVFSMVLQAARARGWTTYFGTDGFSVRVPSNIGLKTAFFGFPAGALGYDVPSFQVTRGNFPADLHDEIDRRLGAAAFRRSGSATFHLAAVDAEGAGVRALLDLAQALAEHE